MRTETYSVHRAALEGFLAKHPGAVVSAEVHKVVSFVFVLVPLAPRLTFTVIHNAGQDAGNRSMRAAGRTEWSKADYDVACAETDRLYALLGDPSPLAQIA